MKAVSFVALAVAMVGTLFAAGVYWRVRMTQPPHPNSGGAVDVDSMRARISKLEMELAQSKDRVSRLERGAPPPPEGSAHVHGSDSNEIAELKKRIEALERRSTPMRNEPGRTSAPNPAAVEYHKKRLLDTAVPPRTRATALGMLRTQGANKADDVVDAGLALLAESQEANLRALILRNLRGAENARVVQPLMTVLKSDPDEDVRDESVRVLGEYVSQPEVRSALEFAAANDASEKVKRQANAAIAAPPQKK